MSRFPDWLLAVTAGSLLLLFMRMWWQNQAPVRNARRARHKGAQGEKRALQLLTRAGYRVIEEQASQTVEVRVDGRLVTTHVRADFLVERRGLRYVAEAKAGPKATSVQNPSTRRQLLEYGLVFRAHGILLIDTHADVIREIVFPGLLSPHAANIRWRDLLLGLLLGILAGTLGMTLAP